MSTQVEEPYEWPYDFPPRSSLLQWSCSNKTPHGEHDFMLNTTRISGPVHCPGRADD